MREDATGLLGRNAAIHDDGLRLGHQVATNIVTKLLAGVFHVPHPDFRMLLV
ncbi:hypothetical protein D3C71_2055660 [compost metagenome]